MKTVALCLFFVFLAALPHLSAAQQKTELYPATKASSLDLGLTSEEQDWLHKNLVLTVGNETDWLPFDLRAKASLF